MLRIRIAMGAGYHLELKWRLNAACFLLIRARPHHHPRWSTWELASGTCNHFAGPSANRRRNLHDPEARFEGITPRWSPSVYQSK
jgi:hypothetical protein